MVCRMVPALDPAGRANPEVQDRSKVPTDAKAEPTKMGMSGLSITTNETQAAAIGGRAMKTAHSGLDKLAMGNSGRGAFQPSWPQFGWLRAYSRRRTSKPLDEQFVTSRRIWSVVVFSRFFCAQGGI